VNTAGPELQARNHLCHSPLSTLFSFRTPSQSSLAKKTASRSVKVFLEQKGKWSAQGQALAKPFASLPPKSLYGAPLSEDSDAEDSDAEDSDAEDSDAEHSASEGSVDGNSAGARSAASGAPSGSSWAGSGDESRPAEPGWDEPRLDDCRLHGWCSRSILRSWMAA